MRPGGARKESSKMGGGLEGGGWEGMDLLAGTSVFTPPMYPSCVLVAHVFNPICIPSASGHLPPHPCSVCLLRRSLPAPEPPAPPLFLGLTLNLPCERAFTVPPHASCAPQHQPPLSGPQLSQRPWSLGSLSQSGLCRFPVEGHAWPLLPPLLPRLWPRALRPLGRNPLQSTLRRPSRLQPYSRPSKPRRPQRSQQS